MEPLPESRLLYSFDHTFSKLQYIIGSKGGSWARRANISIPASFANVQILGGDLKFGKGFADTVGVGVSSVLWMGGIGDMVVSKHAWNDAQVSEYFAVADNDFNTLSYYSEQVWAWLRPGTYIEIIDVKGKVASWSLIGGSPSDFKHVADSHAQVD